MIIFEFIDPQFDEKFTSLYRLSILFGVDSLVYFIADTGNKILYLKDYNLTALPNAGNVTAVLSDVIEKDAILQLQYGKKKISYVSTKTVLIPDRYYDEREKYTYLNALTTLEPLEKAEMTDLPLLNAKVIFPLSVDTKDLINSHFKHVQIDNAVVSLLKKYQEIAAKIRNKIVFLNLRLTFIQITVFEGSELLFYNAFKFNSSRDILYFVLLVFDQLKLNREEVPLMISGKIEEDSEVYMLLYRYVLNLVMMSVPKISNHYSVFADVSPHYYYDVLTSL